MARPKLSSWLCPIAAVLLGAFSTAETAAQMQSMFGGRGPVSNAAVPMGNTRMGASPAGMMGGGMMGGGMGMGGMGMGGMGMGPGMGGMGMGMGGPGMGMGMGQMGMGQMGMGQMGMGAGMMGGMPGGGFVGANPGFAGDPRMARPMQQRGAQQMNRSALAGQFGAAAQAGGVNQPTPPPPEQGALRPQQRIAFDYPQPNPAQVTTRLAAQLADVTERRPELNGVRIESGGGQEIVLRGEVASEQARRLAERLVRLEPGVRSVRNELTVAGQ